jgi:2-amino-4-hydroxy-6-hydroxymethyldihydropteridine diphosphokinase
MPLTRAYVGFGSNIGDRLETMRAALKMLTTESSTSCCKTSPVYENRAIGMGDAEPFLNAVVEFTTRLDADELLDLCLEVEIALGRERSEHWAPRTMDLDLLVYGTLHRDEERLQLPHPRIEVRDFVAQPLFDLAPDLEIRGRRLSEILASLEAHELKLYELRL